MGKIATYTSGLTPAEKCLRGETIYTLSLNNQKLPGNGPALTEFKAANTKLTAACAKVEVLRERLADAVTDRDETEAAWDVQITSLAGVTYGIANGDPAVYESAGFGSTRPPTPPQPLEAPQNLTVQTNGSPGVSKVKWKNDPEADSYLIQCSLDPTSPANWGPSMPTVKASFEATGGEPGKVCWFRVCGVNALGQGPWSEPARRPVM